jgi:hypothetical protein
MNDVKDLIHKEIENKKEEEVDKEINENYIKSVFKLEKMERTTYYLKN